MADWYSSRCALTWKLKGTKYSRLLFQLVPKTLRIAETDAGLLLKTPCSADAYTENLTKKEQRFGNSGTLAQEVQTGFIYQRGMLPTPSASDTEGSPKRKDQISQGGNGNWRRTSDNTGIMFGAKLMDVAPIIAGSNGKNSHLNPRFVAEMMGYPVNWTELPFQNGEKNQSKDMETP